MKRLFLILTAVLALYPTSLSAANIKIIFGLTYDSIKSNVRTFGLWYDGRHPMNDRNMPIFVYIHGGGWIAGGAYGQLGAPGEITPGECSTNVTVVCYMASLGYAVYSINYTLAQPNVAHTKWPAQWQDCDCFLKFLAEQAGRTVPGDPNRIVIMGHSAGAHLALAAGLIPHHAFPPDCGHESLAYTVEKIIAASAPENLVQLFNDGSQAAGAISNLLGCNPDPTNPTCQEIARGASPTTYVAQNQPSTLVLTGFSDPTIPWSTQGDLKAEYAALNPPVVSQWTVFGGPGQPAVYYHLIDLFYYQPCSALNEPSPCGSAGNAFQRALQFLSLTQGF